MNRAAAQEAREPVQEAVLELVRKLTIVGMVRVMDLSNVGHVLLIVARARCHLPAQMQFAARVSTARIVLPIVVRALLQRRPPHQYVNPL